MVLPALQNQLYSLYKRLIAYIPDLNFDWEFFLTAALIIAVSIYLLLRYMGCFYKIKFQKGIFREKTFIYQDIQSTMKGLGYHFQNIENDMKKVFTLSRTGGIYHDDPNGVKKESDCRVSVGFFVNEGEEFKVCKFVDQFSHYSYFIAPSKVYPAYHKLIKESNIPCTECGCPIEFYNFNTIDFYFPVYESKEVTKISPIPMPQYKKSYMEE